MPRPLYEKYVWEIPVRVCHWVIVAAIIVLSLTGLYIGSPRSLALSPSSYIMGSAHFIHAVAGYVFTISFISRIYWAFAGNHYASWREFLPFLSREGRSNIRRTFRYYVFLDRRTPDTVGHNALAGTAYLVLFLLYLVMILTGFALYSQYAPHGGMHRLFGWMFMLFTNQGMRQTHHLVMWLIIAFAIHHVYSSWLMDIKERGGVMSSIFSGYKTVRGPVRHDVTDPPPS